MMAQYESFPTAPSMRTRDRSPRSDLSDEYTLSEDGVPMLRSPPKRNSSLGRRQGGPREVEADPASFSDELINRFDTLRITMRWEYELEKDKRLSDNFDSWQPGIDLTLNSPPLLVSTSETTKQRNPIPSFDPPTINKASSVVSKLLHSASSSFSGLPSARSPSQRSASSVERHRSPIPSFEPPPAPAPVTSVSTTPSISMGGDSHSFVSSPSIYSTNGMAAATAPPPPLPTILPFKIGPSPLAGGPGLAGQQTMAPGPKKIEKLRYQVDSEPPESDYEPSERPTSSSKHRKSLMGRLFGGSVRPSKSSDQLSNPNSRQKPQTSSRASAPPPSREEEWAPNGASNIKPSMQRRADINEHKTMEIKKSEKTLVDDNFSSSTPYYRGRPYEPQLAESRKADKVLVEDDFVPNSQPLRRAVTNPESDTRQSTTTSIGARSRSKLPTIDSDSSSGSLRPPKSNIHDNGQAGSFRGRTADNSSSLHSSSPYGTLNAKNFLDEDEPLAAIRNVLAGISPAPSPSPSTRGNRPLPLPSLALAPPEPVHDERPVSSQGQAFSYARTQPTPAPVAPVRPASAHGRVEQTQGRSVWGAMFGTVRGKRGKEKGKQEAAEKAGRRASAKSTDDTSVSSEPTKKMFGSTKKKPKKEKEGRKD